MLKKRVTPVVMLDRMEYRSYQTHLPESDKNIEVLCNCFQKTKTKSKHHNSQR